MHKIRCGRSKYSNDIRQPNITQLLTHFLWIYILSYKLFNGTIACKMISNFFCCYSPLQLIFTSLDAVNLVRAGPDSHGWPCPDYCQPWPLLKIVDCFSRS